MVNKRRTKRVLDEGIAGQVSSLLQNVVKHGTATRAQIPGVMVAGKTGTTENYGDAWFVAWTKEYTVAVWVGYPDEFKPMKTEFQGDPVAGGTYPAGIWKTFMQYLLKIDPLPKKDGGDGTGKDLEPDRRRPAPATRPAADGRPAPPVAPETPPARRRHDGAAADRGAAAADRGQPPPTEDSRRRPRSSRRRPTPGPEVAKRRLRLTGPARRACIRPGGQGRETSREPSAQKRHGSSAAFVIPIRTPVTYGSRSPSWIRIGPLTSDVSFSVSSIPSAWVSLPGPLVSSTRAAARAHLLQAVQRLQRPDQHGRADALRLADGVEQRVDAVGAVDVGRARRAVQDVRARRDADVGVAGRLGEVVGLGLDDHARGRAVGRPRSRAGPAPRPAPADRKTTPLGRRVQRRAGVGQLLAHAIQLRPALALLGLEPRPLG